MPDPRITYKVQIDKDGAIKGFQAVEGAINKMAKQQKEGLAGLKDGWTKMSSAMGIARQILGYIGDAIDFADKQVKIMNMSDAFKATNANAQEFLDTLNAKADGTLSQESMVKIANGMGKVKEAAVDLADAAPEAFKLAAATGQDLEKVMLDMAKSAKTLNTSFLEEVGIVVDVDLALKAYAAELGKTTDAMTDAEKATAVLKAEQYALAEEFNSFDPSDHIASVGKVKAAWDDAWQSIFEAGKLAQDIKKAGGADEYVQLMAGQAVEAYQKGMEKIQQEMKNKPLQAEIAAAGFVLPVGFEGGATKGSALGEGDIGKFNKEAQTKALAEQKKADALAAKQAQAGAAAAAKAQAALQKQHDELASYQESLREAERQKAFDMADEAAQLQVDTLAAERDYLTAKLQMEADAAAESEAIKQAEIDAVRAERDAYLDLASAMGDAVAAITGSKKMEAAAIAGVAGIKAGFEVAESLASFASGNIPAGIGHAAAAVQYGITAGTNVAKVFASSEKAKEDKGGADLKAQSQGGKASLSKMGTSTAAAPTISIVFQGDVVGSNEKWLTASINRAIRQGYRINEKGIGKTGIDL